LRTVAVLAEVHLLAVAAAIWKNVHHTAEELVASRAYSEQLGR
jgi:hypothetical protein